MSRIKSTCSSGPIPANTEMSPEPPEQNYRVGPPRVAGRGDADQDRDGRGLRIGHGPAKPARVTPVRGCLRPMAAEDAMTDLIALDPEAFQPMGTRGEASPRSQPPTTNRRFEFTRG